MYSRPTAPSSIGGFVGDVFRLFAAAWPMSLVIAAGATLLPLIHFPLYVFYDEKTVARIYSETLIFILFWVRRTLDLSLLAHLNNVATAGKRSTLNPMWTGVRLMPRSLVAGGLYLIGALILLLVVPGSIRMGWPELGDVGSVARGIAPILIAILAFDPAAIVIYAVLGSIGMTGETGWDVWQGAGILLVVPGLIWVVSLAFYLAAIVIDDAAAVQSLKTSYALTKRHWWRTAAFLTVLLLMNYATLPGFMGGVVLAVAGIESTEATNQTLAFMARVVTTTLTAAATVSMYHDLKLRCAEDAPPRLTA